MSETKTIASITPRRRSQEERLFSDGSREIRCFSPANPHYYKDREGVLRPIDMAVVEEKGTGVGQARLRSRNVVSAGVRADGVLTKAVGLRPDFSQAKGDHQLEFSLVSVSVDGVDQAISGKVSAPVVSAKDAKAWDMGRFLVIQNRRFCRQAVLIDRPAVSFRIEFLLHVKGLTVTPAEASGRSCWHVRDASGEADWMIAEPLILDGDLSPIMDADGLPASGRYVIHALTDNKNGTFTYVKESVAGADFSALPARFWVDASTVYSSTDDGLIYGTGPSWADALSGVALGVGNGDGFFANMASANRGSSYFIYRSYFYFDTSALNGASAATLYIRGGTNQSGSAIAQLGTQGSPLAGGDYNAFSGNAYNSAITWTASGWNAIAFNATGVGNIDTSGITKVCVREAHDFNNDAPAASFSCGGYFADTTGTDYDPYLSIVWTLTRATAIDGAVQSSVASSAGADALVESQGNATTAGLDGIVGVGFTETGLKANLVRRFDASLTVDAIVFSPTVFGFAGLSALLSRASDRAVSLGGVVSAGGIAALGMDAVREGVRSAAAGLSGCVQADGAVSDTQLNAKLQAVFSVSSVMDAAVMEGFAEVVAVDAVALATTELPVSIDAIPVTPGAVDCSLDAVGIAYPHASAGLSAGVMSSPRLGCGIDAGVMFSGTETCDADAVLEGRLASVAVTDAVVITPKAGAIALDAAIGGRASDGVSMNAALSSTGSAAAGLDSLPQVLFAAACDLDVIVLATLGGNSDVDAVLEASGVFVGLDVDAMCRVSGGASAGVDAAITATRLPYCRVDACFGVEADVLAVMDASVTAEGLAACGSDAVLIRYPALDAGFDARLCQAHVNPSGVDAIVIAVPEQGVSLDALTTQSTMRCASVDGRVEKTAASPVGLGGCAYSVNTQATAMDAYHQAAWSATLTADSRVEGQYTDHTLMDAVVCAQIEKRTALSAILSMAHAPVYTSADAVLAGRRIPPGATANEIVYAPFRTRRLSAGSRVRRVSSPIRSKTIYYQP